MRARVCVFVGVCVPPSIQVLGADYHETLFQHIDPRCVHGCIGACMGVQGLGFIRLLYFFRATFVIVTCTRLLVHLPTFLSRSQVPDAFGGECKCDVPGGCLFNDVGPWSDPDTLRVSAHIGHQKLFSRRCHDYTNVVMITQMMS